MLYWGIKYFKGDPNILENYGPGLQVLWGPNTPLQFTNTTPTFITEVLHLVTQVQLINITVN